MTSYNSASHVDSLNNLGHTVDGRNLAPVDRQFIPEFNGFYIFKGFYISQMVITGFLNHQQ